MIEIIPAIMPQNIGDLRGKLSLVRHLVDSVQIDLCDGKFVKTKTWPYNGTDEQALAKILNEEDGLPFWDEFDFEFDLMVTRAEHDIDMFMKLGAKRLVFHLEAEDNTDNAFLEFLEGIDPYIRENIQIGLALNTTTPVESVFPFVPHLDFVQCMGIEHIGYQGEPFDNRVVDQLKALKERFPEIMLSVDGAVNFETAHELIAAGADRLIIGSAIFSSTDIADTIADFQNLVL